MTQLLRPLTQQAYLVYLQSGGDGCFTCRQNRGSIKAQKKKKSKIHAVFPFFVYCTMHVLWYESFFWREGVVFHTYNCTWYDIIPDHIIVRWARLARDPLLAFLLALVKPRSHKTSK
jgi:hypothetical protein